MLKRLTIEGFRSFKRTEIDFEDVTVLVGPNGAGKSNLAYALLTLAKLLNAPLYESTGAEPRFGDAAFDDLTFRLDPSQATWRFHAEFAGDDGNGSYDVAVSRGRFPKGLLVVERESLVYQPPGVSQAVEVAPDAAGTAKIGDTSMSWPADCTLPVRGVDLLLSGGQPAAEKAAAAQAIRWLKAQLPFVARFAPDPAVMRRARLGGIQRPTSSGLGFPLVLRRARERAGSPFPRIVERLRRIAPFVEDVGFHVVREDVALEFKLANIDRPVSGVAVSDGTILALFLAWVAETSWQRGILVLEDPDRSLHPYVHGVLLEWVRNLLADQRVAQVVLTTHSPTFVNVACHDAPERLRIVERSDEHGTVFSTLVPARSEELARAVELYREAPGTLWYSGVAGGVPPAPEAAPAGD